MNSTRAPYTATGMCIQATFGQRQVRKEPKTTKPMNSRWTTTTASAATRYHTCSTLDAIGARQNAWTEPTLLLVNPADAERVSGRVCVHLKVVGEVFCRLVPEHVPRQL